MASTVQSFSDMAPQPRARIDLDVADLGGAAAVTVWQLSKWGQVAVRGAVRRAPGAGLVVEDYELPPGVPVTYRVETFDGSGNSTGFASLSLAAEVSVPVGWAVISDPLSPADAVLVRAQQGFAGVLTKRRASKRYQAGGRTFAMSGLYSAFLEVPLQVFTETEDERELLAAILEQPLILVRTPPQMRLPGSFFAAVDEVPMVPVDAIEGGEMDGWGLVAAEVTRPDLEVIVAVYSYDHFKAYLDTLHPPTPGTYNDAAAEWATYIDAMRNPPPFA